MTPSKGKRFEILDGLPPYGPMYIPIAEDGEPFYYEGYVVKFIKSDGAEWVANFKLGWTEHSLVMEFANAKRILVLAGGMAYLMDPDSETPLEIFGPTIHQSHVFDENHLVCCSNLGVDILGRDGIMWSSPQISWDGIYDVTIEGNLLKGMAYAPTHEKDEWVEFSINLETKEIVGGSFSQDEPKAPKGKSRAWWQFWK